MAKDTLYEELSMLIFTTLQLDCPVMAGNMKSHIDIEEIGNNFTRIAVSGPSYDIATWQKTGQIEYTGEYDYAISVNEVGAFNGRSTKSKHWANKSVVKVCKVLGAMYNAEVIVNVDL